MGDMVKKRLKVVVVSSEVAPLAKTGGLADVAGSLPAALVELGHDVTVFLPAYGVIDREVYPLTTESNDLEFSLGRGKKSFQVLRSNAIPGVTVKLIDIPDLFARDGIYDKGGVAFPDNAVRFSSFSLAVLELIRLEKDPPDIIHCNDWHTGLIPANLSLSRKGNSSLRNTRVVFTIHNAAYQGFFPMKALKQLCQPQELVLMEEEFKYYDGISLLKGGIIFSDIITTVSPTYSREIQTRKYGMGLERTLRGRSSDLHGVLNGIDTTEWDPASDNSLPEPYRPGDWDKREKVKKSLLDLCGFDHRDGKPVIGIVSRLASQKGFDLLEEAVPELMSRGVRLVILGIGEKRFERFFKTLMKRYPEQVFARFDFDNRLAHMIYGGSDIFLMPSRFEPCGLGQMIAMRYGAVPVARNTGGLAETVFDEEGRRNGFLFRNYTAAALTWALRRALKAHRNRDEWRKIMCRGMEGDYSWTASARRYLELYRLVLGREPAYEVKR
jgi:starch synthase